MRAVQYSAFGQTPRLVERPEPDCPPHGVLVSVAASGVCRSDWHVWAGHDPAQPLPTVPGHEFAGTVASIGDRVTGDWWIGQRVTAPFVCACGECAMCERGEHQVCLQQEQPGFTYDGSFAERVVVPHADVNLVAVPDAVDLVTAAALGCRFATAYRAVTVHAAVQPGDRIAVFGCGGVGLSAVMIAAAHGAEVTAVDPSADARRVATQLGAAFTVDPSTGARVRDMDASLDALGSAATASASIRSLRPRGRHVQVGLLLGAEAAAPLPVGRMIAHELAILGSHGMSAAHYPAMLAEIADGRLDPAALVSRRIPLAEAPSALASGRPSAWGLTVIDMEMTDIDTEMTGEHD